MQDAPNREELIDEVESAWGQAAINRKMTPDEVLHAAGRFLANVLLSIALDEAAAHRAMNHVTETNHLYINAAWPKAKAQRDKLVEQQADNLMAALRERL